MPLKSQDESLRENRTVDRAQGMSVLKTGQEGEEEKQASGVLGAKGGRAQEESRQQCPTCTSQQQRAVLPACWHGFTCTDTLECSHFLPPSYRAL